MKKIFIVPIIPIILLTLMLMGCEKNSKNVANSYTDIPVFKLESEVTHKESDSVHRESDAVRKELPSPKGTDIAIDKTIVSDFGASVTNIVGNEKGNTSITSKGTTPKITLTPKIAPTPTVTPTPTVAPTPTITPAQVKQHDCITLIIQEEGKQILNCSVEIQDGGESLGSVMNRVADRIGMQLTSNGGYISCMNGKQASGFKGWVYSKNGVIPNVGISGQIVTKGDKIVWNYGDHSNLIL